MEYKTENELLEVVRKFEDGTISRDVWGHPEHLIVAFYYASNSDFETALAKMKRGIFNLLKAYKIDLTKNMPYHETLTQFWMRTVFDFIESNKINSNFETIKTMIAKFDKDYPLKFYSREVLFSDKARKTFVDGDLREQNFKIKV